MLHQQASEAPRPRLRINVHVRDKTISVQCGEGVQRAKWLGHVGIARYATAADLGVPQGIRMENGTLLDMEKPINEQLPDDEHVWILLRGE